MDATDATPATTTPPVASPRYLKRKDAAAALGFTRQRLEALIKQGRIEETPAGIDIAKAKEAMARNADVARQVGYRMSVRPPASKKATKRVARPAATTADEPEFDFVKARAEKESWNAKHAEIKYRANARDLVSRKAVQQKEFEIGRMARDRILGWPARVSDMVPRDALQTLINEAEQLCRELQEGCARIADEAGF